MPNVGWLIAQATDAAVPLTLPTIVGMIILISGGMTAAATQYIKFREDKRLDKRTVRKDYVDGSLASMAALSDLRQDEVDRLRTDNDRSLTRIDALEKQQGESDVLAHKLQADLGLCKAECAECLAQVRLLKRKPR